MKKTMKRLVTFLLAICMITGLVCTPAFAAEEKTVISVGGESASTLAEAVTSANAASGGAIIQISGTITLGQKLDITGDVTISGGTIVRDAAYTGTLFTVASGSTLTLKDVIIDGNNNWTFLADEYRAAVESGSRVSNSEVCYTEYEEGAPVATATMITVNGDVIMDGSTIKNSVGCSLFSVSSGASLTLNSATIDHNTKNGSSLLGGVSAGGTLTINAGTVISNNHTHAGNGLLSYMCGTAVMNGGEIFGNTGVDCNGSVMMLYGGSASFTMNDGKIYDNGALYGSYNGWNPAFYVYGNGAKFTMNGGSIEGNFSSVIPGIANNGSNALITLTGGKIINTVSGRGYTTKDVFAYCPVNISNTVHSATNRFYNNVTNTGTLVGNSWFYSYEMSYSGGGIFDGNVTVQSGAETTMVDGAWLNGLVLVNAVGNDTTLTVKEGAIINGTQVRILNSVESGDYLNAEEAAAAQAAAYVQENGANVISPVLFYHRLTSAQMQNIVVTFDYNGGLDAQGWSGCQLTGAEAFAPACPAPTKEGQVLVGWKYAVDNKPECLTMDGTTDYAGEVITESVRLIAQWSTERQLTVNHVDSEGNILAEQEVYTVLEGAEYTTSAKEIEGYTLTATPDNASGTMTSEGVIVTYTYTKQCSLTVNHVDSEGNVLAEQEVYTVLEGAEYTTSAKEIEGYTLTAAPDNASGTMDSDKVVTYVYDVEEIELPDEEDPKDELPGDDTEDKTEGEDDTEIDEEEPPKAETPNTGDFGMIWVLFTVIAAAALFALVLNKRKMA